MSPSRAKRFYLAGAALLLIGFAISLYLLPYDWYYIGFMIARIIGIIVGFGGLVLILIGFVSPRTSEN